MPRWRRAPHYAAKRRQRPRPKLLSRSRRPQGTSRGLFTYTRDARGLATAIDRRGEIFTVYGSPAQGLRTNLAYNTRREVISESSQLAATPHTPVPGRAFSLGYDHAGNRTETTRNGQHSTWTANALNQYNQRTTPAVVDVLGSAPDNDPIEVNGQTATERVGAYFFRQLGVPHGSWQPIRVTAGGDLDATWNATSFHARLAAATEAFAYDADGNLTEDDRWVYTYDAENRLIKMQTRPALAPLGVPLQEIVFVYDYLGRRVEKRVRHNETVGFLGQYYDQGNFVAHHHTRTDNTIDYWLGSEFPGAGQNLDDFSVYWSGTLLPTESGNHHFRFTVDDRFRLWVNGQLVLKSWPAGQGPTPYTSAPVYLHAGEAVEIRVEFYQGWGGARALLEWQPPGSAWTAVNVARSPRLGLSGTDWRVVSHTRYLYQGWNPIAELDGSGSTVVKAHVWGLDLSETPQGAGGVGGWLITADAGQAYLPVLDAMGHVHGVLRAPDAVLVAAYEYDVFGQTVRATGPYAQRNPFGFATKVTDRETGLVYFGHRYYSPSLGRFINRDPIEEVGGRNLYAYCGNDAINHWDYLGQSFFKSIGKFFKKYWKPIVAVVASVVTYGAASGWAAGWVAGAGLTGTTASVATGAIAGAASGFVGGAVGAGLNGADSGGALRAGLIGGTIGAVSGGILGKLGTFEGFSSQMKFSTYLGKMAQATTVGAVGSGTAAELSGGKFRDGFESGAAWSAGSFVVTAGLQTYLTEKGETVYPEGGSKNSAQYKDVTTNGILGNPAAFQAKVNRAGILGYYNPSQGIINDVMQSLFQKTLFGWGDSLAKGFASLTSKMMPGPLTITAHSQGTLTVTNAIFRGGVPDGSVLNLRSPAISYPRAWLAGQINHSPMNYIQPWGDGANLWSPSLNPLKLASGVLDIFAGAGIHTGNYP